MINLFVSDFYRFVRTRAFQLSSILMVLTSVAVAVFRWWITTPMYAALVDRSNPGSLSLSVSVKDNATIMANHTSGYSPIVAVVTLILVILSVVVVMLDSNTGFIRNVLAGKSIKRGTCIAEKFIFLFIITFISLFATIGIAELGHRIAGFTFAASTVESFGTWLLWMMLVALFIFCFECIAIAIALLFNSSSAGIIAGILVTLGVVDSILKIVLNFASLKIGWLVHVTQWLPYTIGNEKLSNGSTWLVTTAGVVTRTFNMPTGVYSVLVFAWPIVIAIVIAALVVRKRDF